MGMDSPGPEKPGSSAGEAVAPPGGCSMQDHWPALGPFVAPGKLGAIVNVISLGKEGKAKGPFSLPHPAVSAGSLQLALLQGFIVQIEVLSASQCRHRFFCLCIVLRCVAQVCGTAQGQSSKPLASFSTT